MKLFTSEINQRLFKQYPLGGNLEKQVVVCKIFNPYSNGRWYLLNSDPADPDYLWAIVEMGGTVEIGSVSRKELETARVGRFKLPLERDLGYSMTNAKEVYDGLLKGKFFKEGGEVKNDGSNSTDISKALLKYARQDVNLLEKKGYMMITQTKHGNLDCEYENGVYTIGDKFKGNKAEAIEYVKNAYQVVQSDKMAHGGMVDVGRTYKMKSGENLRFVGKTQDGKWLFMNSQEQYFVKDIHDVKLK
jgi:hypothetical protein